MKSTTALLVLSLIPITTMANARLFNPLAGSTSDATYLVNNKSKQTMAVTSFNVDLTGCETSSGMMKIEKITMDDDDKYPQKMSFRDINSNRISMPTNFSLLDNASRSWVDGMFSEGDWVYVHHAVCGSGGFETMLSIAKHTKVYPAAGVTINP